MGSILSYCELKINTYNLDEVPDDIIKEVIGNSSKEDAILYVLFRCNYQVNSEKIPYSFDYFTNLVDKISKVSGYDYSDDELTIYKAFAIPADYKNVDDAEALYNLIKLYEKVDSMTVSGDNLSYAQECVRYNLLLIYSNNVAAYYDKMKDLLLRLKKNRNKYIELRDVIFKKK